MKYDLTTKWMRPKRSAKRLTLEAFNRELLRTTLPFRKLGHHSAIPTARGGESPMR